jgi:hypothetical protein
MSEETKTEPPWVDLGYMNGWYHSNPKEYDQCRAAKHPLRGATIGRCVNQTWCDTCRITWKVDSSD